MGDRLLSICRWCKQSFAGNRRFCCSDCRGEAHESKNHPGPTLDEILEMCSIRDEGGGDRERNRSCYPLLPAQVRVVSASRSCAADNDD